MYVVQLAERRISTFVHLETFCLPLKRPVGFDIGKGERILSRGDLLGPAELGLLATAGVLEVILFKKLWLPKLANFHVQPANFHI